MYYFVFGFFYLLSLLPFFMLYLFSDAVAFVLYHIARYRRKVVYENVKGSFPEMDDVEVRRVVKEFYRNFTDNWIETIKLLSISPETLKKRMQGNFDVLHTLHQQGKTAVGISGHLFNWEYMNAVLGLRQPYQLICVYMPLTNKAFDRLFQFIRSRFGPALMAATTLNRDIITWRRKQYLLGLIADQSPGDPGKAFWLEFLHRPTGFVTGPERNSQVFSQVPVFATITRRKRGHYFVDFQLLGNDYEPIRERGEITRLLAQRIEENIRLDPSLYLWSHKRWKHPWKAEYQGQWIDSRYPVPENGK